MTDLTARERLLDVISFNECCNGGTTPEALLDAHQIEVLAEFIPPWEAIYDSATFTPRLLAYCNDLAAAKGAAEAWLRSQVEDAAGLTWVPDPQMAAGGWDQWFQLFRDSPYGDGASDTEIVVRRRASRPSGDR